MKKAVSATALAKLGKCERQLYYDLHYGEDEALTASLRLRGQGEHERFYQRITGRQDQRCFVATALFGGAAWETEALRDWRDRVLRSWWGGRCAVWFYYRVSPYLVSLLSKQPRLCAALRYRLQWLALQWLLRRRA